MLKWLKKPQSNSDKVFSQWIQFVQEDNETWINPLYKNSKKR